MKVAVIGLGWWGKQIISCLKPSDKLEVITAFDPAISPDQASDHGLDLRLSDSFEAVLNNNDVEGVILATPHKLHDEQVMAVVKAGKHVFCEKPLSLTAAGVRQMVKMCEDNNVILGVGHERRFEPGMEIIAEMLANGEFGKLVSMDANFSHNKFKNFDRKNWRLSKENAPAGAMTALGIHLTDMFISLAGEVVSVYAQASSRVFEEPAIDALSATLTFDSGLTATFSCLSTIPFYGRFTVMGERAWAELREYSNVDVDEPATLTIVRDSGERTVQELQAINTVLLNFESWADAISGKGDYRYTNIQKINNIEVLEGIIQSLETSNPVTISKRLSGDNGELSDA